MIEKAKRKDVAKLAGVSETVVSYVINNKARQNRISPETATRVRRIAEELGYRPSVLGRALKTQKSNLLALVSENITDPHTIEIFRALNTVVNEKGYGLLVGEWTASPDTFKVLNIDFAEAIFLHLPSASSISLCENGRLSGKPTCFIGGRSPQQEIPYVEVDNVEGARLAISHLCDQGVRRIGIVADRKDYSFVNERLDGCRQAMQKYEGCSAQVYYRDSNENQYQAGETALNEWRRLQSMPEGIFAMGDVIAIGVLHALHRYRNELENKNVRVIGFDGLPFCRYTTPSLSTIRQPYEAMAQAAFEIIDDSFRNHSNPALQTIIPPSLVERDSSRIGVV